MMNTRVRGGMTPLHEAIWKGHEGTARWMIEHGADVAATTSTKVTIYSFACEHAR